MLALRGTSVGSTCRGCGEPRTHCLNPGLETSALYGMVSPDWFCQASFSVQTGTPYHPDRTLTVPLCVGFLLSTVTPYHPDRTLTVHLCVGFLHSTDRHSITLTVHLCVGFLLGTDRHSITLTVHLCVGFLLSTDRHSISP